MLRPIALLLALVSVLVVVESTHLRPQEGFDPRFSLRPPYYLVQGSLPYWSFGGSTLVSEDYIRLTPDLQSKKGWVWNHQPNYFQSWEIVIEFRIHGKRMGADGLAFWYAAEPNMEGSVYGSKDQWKGLGVFFDTFDNNGKAYRGNSQSVVAVKNDGTVMFDHGSDGESISLASCNFNLRNTPKPIFARITYLNGVLSIDLDVANSGTWSKCMETTVELPTGYYFGLSAATGGLADNHDMFSMSTTNIGPRGVPGMKAPVVEEVPKAVHQQQQQQQPTPGVPVVNVEDSNDGESEKSVSEIRKELMRKLEALRIKEEAEEKVRAEAAAAAAASAAAAPPPPPPPPLPPAAATVVTPPAVQQPEAVPTPPAPAAGAAAPAAVVGGADAASVEGLLKSNENIAQQIQLLNARLDGVIRQITSDRDSITELLRTSINQKAGLSTTDLETANRRVINEVTAVVTSHFSSVSGSMSDMLKRFFILDDVKALSTEVVNNLRNVKNSLDASQNEHRKVLEQQDSILDNIDQKSAISGWVFVIVFQAVFLGVFIWWKKVRDDQKKYL